MKFKESKNFSDFSLYRIFESEHFKGFLLYEKLKILSPWNGRLEIFSFPWDRENSSQFLRLRKDIFTENSRYVPLSFQTLAQETYETLKKNFLT